MTDDREPLTEAGREYLAAVSADTWSPEGRIEWARRFVLAIEAEAAADVERLRAAIEQGRWRAQDLRWCNKADDCQTKADGAELVIADIDAALADPAG